MVNRALYSLAEAAGASVLLKFWFLVLVFLEKGYWSEIFKVSQQHGKQL
jgi:hypothetical protein